MAKHTPGPWKAIKHNIGKSGTWFIQFEGSLVKHSTIASMNGPCLAYNNAENDARLIAAAPDMLEALKELFEREWQDDDGSPTLEAARGKAKAAIAKAEGHL